jgi:hypothetical protein
MSTPNKSYKTENKGFSRVVNLIMTAVCCMKQKKVLCCNVNRFTLNLYCVALRGLVLSVLAIIPQGSWIQTRSRKMDF